MHWPVFGPYMEAALCAVLRAVIAAVSRQCGMTCRVTAGSDAGVTGARCDSAPALHRQYIMSVTLRCIQLSMQATSCCCHCRHQRRQPIQAPHCGWGSELSRLCALDHGRHPSLQVGALRPVAFAGQHRPPDVPKRACALSSACRLHSHNGCCLCLPLQARNERWPTVGLAARTTRQPQTWRICSRPAAHSADGD